MAGKTAKAPAKATEPERVYVYIGPSIRGVIQNATIYHGKRSEVFGQLSGAIGTYPEIETLIVEDTELASAREKIRAGGNAYSIAYKSLLSK